MLYDMKRTYTALRERQCSRICAAVTAMQEPRLYHAAKLEDLEGVDTGIVPGTA